MHFTKLTFPNGYTVLPPGSAESAPGAEKWRVTDKEGTIQADPQRGQDAATVAGTAATGAAIGGLTYGGKGPGIGAGAGGGVGLATVLLTDGNEVHLDAGTAVVMVFQRPLTLEPSRITGR